MPFTRILFLTYGFALLVGCSWTLDWKELTSNAVIIDGEAREVLFHPTVSHGTAAVRGSACLTRGLHYWEIEMVSKCYGTDMVSASGRHAYFGDHEYAFITSFYS